MAWAMVIGDKKTNKKHPNVTHFKETKIIVRFYEWINKRHYPHFESLPYYEHKIRLDNLSRSRILIYGIPGYGFKEINSKNIKY